MEATKKLGFGFMRLPLKDKDNAESIDFTVLNSMVDTFLERGVYLFRHRLYVSYGKERNCFEGEPGKAVRSR